MDVVEFPVDGNSDAVVRVAEGGSDTGLSRAGAADRVARAAVATWGQALDGVRTAAEGMVHQISRIDPAPAEATITFGVAVNGRLGATLVSGGSDAHLTVSVTWRNPAAPDPAAPEPAATPDPATPAPA